MWNLLSFQRKLLQTISGFSYFCDYHCNSKWHILYLYIFICSVISIAIFVVPLPYAAVILNAKDWECVKQVPSRSFLSTGLLTLLSNAVLPSILGPTTVGVTFQSVHLLTNIWQVYKTSYIFKVYMFTFYFMSFFQPLPID